VALGVVVFAGGESGARSCHLGTPLCFVAEIPVGGRNGRAEWRRRPRLALGALARAYEDAYGALGADEGRARSFRTAHRHSLPAIGIRFQFNIERGEVR
jgi:hypothetical protein